MKSLGNCVGRSSDITGQRNVTEPLEREWINKPQQARSKETMNRFVVAAEELLRGRYFDDITIGEIVEGADRTVGSFYARFDDKWALLRTVLSIYLAKIRDLIDDLFDGVEWNELDIEEMIRVLVDASVGLYRNYGHIFRAGLSFSATDEQARIDYLHHNRHITDQMTISLLAHRQVTSSDEQRRRIELALEASQSILDTRLLYNCDWHVGEPIWDDVARDIEEVFIQTSGVLSR